MRWEDLKTFDQIKKKADELVDVFYDGYPLTPFEKDVFQRYLDEKYEKLIKFQANKFKRY